MQLRLFTEDKKFYKNMLMLAIPIIGQNIIGLLLNMTDTVMLGRLPGNSESAISAANFGGQPFFVYTLFLFGIVSGSSVLMSQYWGKRDMRAINRISGIALTAALAVGTLFTLACYLLPDPILSLFAKTEATRELAKGYLLLTAASYLPYAVTNVLSGVMRTTERVRAPLAINCFAVFLNIILNYIFIFGAFGAPAMDVRGAALATLIARVTECVLTVIYVFVIPKKNALSPTQMFRFSRPLTMDFIKYSTPVILNESIWGLGMTFHASIMGKLGDEVYAAYTVTELIERVGMLIAFGLANTATIIIGRTIGEGKKEKTFEYAKSILSLCVLSGALFAVLIFFLRGAIVNAFNIAEETKTIARTLIAILTFVLLAKAFNAPNVVGIIRGGGDTRAALIFDALPMWLISIPLGYCMANFLHVPEYLVFFCLISDEFIKLPFGFWYFIRKKWIKTVTREDLAD